MALADPLRLRLWELLLETPSSAKELARRIDVPPDRLYYHLRQLERAGLIEVADYRRLEGGKVERVYQVVEVEPPGDDSGPEDTTRFLAAVLDATQADIAAAFQAKQAGRRREVRVARTTVRLTPEAYSELHEQISTLIRQAEQRSTSGERDDAQPVRVLYTLVDLQDRT